MGQFVSSFVPLDSCVGGYFPDGGEAASVGDTKLESADDGSHERGVRVVEQIAGACEGCLNLKDAAHVISEYVEFVLLGVCVEGKVDSNEFRPSDGVVLIMARGIENI